MRSLLQFASVLALALGVGLVVAGQSMSTGWRSGDMSQMMRSLERSSREAQEERMMTSMLFGFGAGFLSLGALGLIVPWCNALVYGRKAPPAAAGGPSTDGTGSPA